MPEGVPAVPSATPGSSGVQPAAVAPATQEAKTAAISFGAPASGAVQKDNRVPLERFQEIFNRMKGAEDELARLKSAPQPVRSIEDRMVEVRALMEQGIEDPRKLAVAVEQAAALKATDVVTNMLRGLAEDQHRESQEARFHAARQAALERAFQEFPELQNQESEFFKSTSARWASDPSLQQIPDGELKAAQIEWFERARRSGAKPNNLAAPVLGAVKSDDFGADRAKALEALKAGKMADVEKFFTGNAKRFIRKPH